MIEPIGLDLAQPKKYFFQHCYAIIDLNKEQAIINYYEDRKPNAPLDVIGNS